MKPIQIAEDIVPLADFKAHASRLFRQLREEQRPLIITQNGKPAGVLITPEEFDRTCERSRFIEAVQEGLVDSEAGRLIDDEQLGLELDAEFGRLNEAPVDASRPPRSGRDRPLHRMGQA